MGMEEITKILTLY